MDYQLPAISIEYRAAWRPRDPNAPTTRPICLSTTPGCRSYPGKFSSLPSSPLLSPTPPSLSLSLSLSFAGNVDGGAEAESTYVLSNNRIDPSVPFAYVRELLKSLALTRPLCSLPPPPPPSPSPALGSLFSPVLPFSRSPVPRAGRAAKSHESRGGT